MSRARKGQKGLDRVSTSRLDKRAHRQRLRAARRDAPTFEHTPRAVVLDLLACGLIDLDELRRRYGDHSDFDLVETHQRKLMSTLTHAPEVRDA